MVSKYFITKATVLVLLVTFCCVAISPTLGTPSLVMESINNNPSLVFQDYILPPPQFIDKHLEKTIMHRMSVREFTEEPVTDEELSTILWAAYGLREDGVLTVSEINGSHAAIIYILKEDAVYKYDPYNHALVFYKEGDYRDIVGWQWKAPIQLGLCWNTDIADANFGSAELGAVGQNIYFAANAIGLGTVITAQGPEPAIKPVELPPNEKGMGVMPLGHPEFSYDFVYRPMLISFLPRIKCSGMSITTVLEERNPVTIWDTDSISRVDLCHLIWASYGYSYYLDESGSMNVVKRHHTVPSAHGYYPFRIYGVTKSGVYRYIYGIFNIDLWGLPVVSFLLKIANDDKRSFIAQASNSFVADAPLNIIIVLDIEKTIDWDDLSDESERWIWYYEAGAAAHNVLLQATARNLAGNIVSINDKSAICSILGLSNDKFDPMFIVPVG
jgi:nitroreductase